MKTYEVVYQHQKTQALYFWRRTGENPPTLIEIAQAMPDNMWRFVQMREVVCKWREA